MFKYLVEDIHKLESTEYKKRKITFCKTNVTKIDCRINITL